MSTVDERLQRLFADAAVEPAASTDVFGAIAEKRRQRHTRRVARNVGALVAALLLVAASLVWLAHDDSTQPAVAPSNVRGPVATRRLGGAWLGARPVEIAPDIGYVRGPLLRSGRSVAIAAYDRDGSGWKVPPSRVVRIDATGRVLDEVELQGEILSLADGEGARWVVTHDADNLAIRQYRVKRIGGDGSVLSNPFPPGVVPTGPIVVGNGAAWVPVSQGVLRFDATTGAYTGTMSLPGWQLPRLVGAGSETYAYSSPLGSKGGSGLLELVRLTPNTGAAPDAVRVAEPVLSIAETHRGLWALVWDGRRSLVAPLDPTNGVLDRQRALELARGFAGSEMQSAGSTLWITGAFRDARTSIERVRVHDDGHADAKHPVLLHAPDRSDVLGLNGHNVLVTADGRLYRVAAGS